MGLIGEIVSIVVLTIVAAKLEYGIGYEFYKTLVILSVVFASILLAYKFFINLTWWYPQIKKNIMPKDDNSEQDIRFSMALFFFLLALMLYLHLELVLGAFVAGMFIQTFFGEKKD